MKVYCVNNYFDKNELSLNKWYYVIKELNEFNEVYYKLINDNNEISYHYIWAFITEKELNDLTFNKKLDEELT